MRTEIKIVGELSPEYASLIRSSNHREFGNDSLVYDNPEWYVLGFHEEIPVTHVGILSRTITVNQTSLRVGGVCYLVSEPEYRGRGFARAVMNEAADFVKTRLRLPFGLLTCNARLEAFYAKLGWRTVAGPTVFMQKDGIRKCGGLTMVIELDGQTWPEGKIDLCGLPW